MSQELKIESKIDSVVVYTDRARVTRTQIVNLSGNESELVICQLPTTIITDSIRASGSGNVAVKLLGVSAQKIFSTEPLGEKVAEIQLEIDNLNLQLQAARDALAGLHLQRDFIKDLSEKSVFRFSQSLAKQQITLGETKNLLNFVGEEYGTLSESIAEQQERSQQLEKELAVKRQQLSQLQNPHPQESLEIRIAIEPAGSGDLQLQVSYMVREASWIPLYDIRVDEAANIALSYLAEVNQGTGEDWNGVKLTLSTAKPGLGTLPPKLNPWYLDIERPPVPVATRSFFVDRLKSYGGLDSPEYYDNDDNDDNIVIQMPDRTRVFNDAEITGNLNAAETERPVEQVAAEAFQKGGTVTFDLDGNNNIPSDRNPHKVTIFHDEYPGNLQHIAIPKLVSYAYLQALVQNPADGVTLLPGKANIFRGDTFVGTTDLENTAPNQELKLNLGIDESIKIERDLVERVVDKKLIGQQRRITYAYRLIITNLGDRLAQLKLTEQLPVSQNEQIKVRLNRTNPQIQLGEMGILEWLLQLPPQAKQEVYYQFVVEYPPQLIVSGLNE